MYSSNHGFSRRDLLKLSVAGGASLCAAPALAATRRKNIPIAVQLFSFRDELGYLAKEPVKIDLPATLAAIREMGYQSIEWYGWNGYFDRSPKELRKMMDDAGLKTCSDHIHAEALQGDRFQQSLELYQALGNTIVTISGMTGPREAQATAQYWLDAAKMMSETAERLKPYGIRLGLHNHGPETRRLDDGRLPWELIFDNTGPNVVQQFHLATWPPAGLDPVAYIKRYPGRTLTMHMTDFAPGRRGLLLGEGVIKWPEVFDAAETVGGIEWYIVEQESYPIKPPRESIRQSLQNLKKLLADGRL